MAHVAQGIVEAGDIHLAQEDALLRKHMDNKGYVRLCAYSDIHIHTPHATPRHALIPPNFLSLQ